MNPTRPAIACIGCGGIVPDIDGPSHRYMLASPGCWATFTGLLGAGPPRTVGPSPHGFLQIDAYAVQHPGVPVAAAIQSVWVHLITLHLALERGWPSHRHVTIRQAGADASGSWAWLEPPASMGAVTAIDVAGTSPTAATSVVRAWVEGAWAAWSAHHVIIRREAEQLVAGFG